MKNPSSGGGVSGRLALMLFISFTAVLSCSGGDLGTADETMAGQAVETWQGVPESTPEGTLAGLPVTDQVAEVDIDH